MVRLMNRLTLNNKSRLITKQSRRILSFMPLAIIASLIMLLVGCGSVENDLQKYIREVKRRPGKPVEPIPTYQPPPKFSYPENDKRRSPFKPIKGLNEPSEQFTPDFDRPKQPLEAFPLDALKFVGTLKRGAQFYALIQKPNGVITRVRAGDYMGKNFGQIINITDEAIELEETIKEGGKWEKKSITLRLRSP